jgi:hypothetical protein
MKQHTPIAIIAFLLAAALTLATGGHARTWTSADGAKTFEGELKSYDPATGKVAVTIADGRQMTFMQGKLSAADLAFLIEQGKTDAPASNKPSTDNIAANAKDLAKMPDGKPADMSKPVKIFILMGQSNMVGLGNKAVLDKAVKEKKKYPYLIDEDGNWIARQDVRFVRFGQGQGLLFNDWLTAGGGGTIGPELGIGEIVGNEIDAPVILLKTCSGGRSLGWDYLPPGSERFEENGTIYAGYKDSPLSWPKGTEPTPIAWYAGKQYDDEMAFIKEALEDIGKYYPGATEFEIAGFFFWQGEKDGMNAVHAANYEKNITAFIKALRKDLNCPNAKFVMGTIGDAVKGSGNKVMEGQFAVDGSSGKHPEFKGNVATVYTHDMAQGGSGGTHYGGNAEVYMDVGEAMGKTMVELLKNKP